MSNLPPPPAPQPGHDPPPPPTPLAPPATGPYLPPPGPKPPKPARALPPPAPSAPLAPPTAAPPPTVLLPPAQLTSPPAGPTMTPPPGTPLPAEGAPPSANEGGGRTRVWAVITAGVVVAAVAAGVIILATRGSDTTDNSGDASGQATATDVSINPDETTTLGTATPSSDAETASSITEPQAGGDDTTTSAGTGGSAAGAIDLGYSTSLPIPSGWSQTNAPGQVATISDGTTSFSAQVLARTPGEDPEILMQEYVNTFDAKYPTVSYGPSRYVNHIDGELPVDQYGIFYATYEPTDGIGLLGGVYVYVRSDGLSAIYDVFGDENVGSLPADTLTAFENSFAAAPPLGPSVNIGVRDQFRVTTTHPLIGVDGLVGFSPAPGFNTITAGGGRGLASNGSYDFDVQKLVGQATKEAAVAAAEASLAASYTGLVFTEPTSYDADSYGVVQSSVGWSGTYVDGTPSSGGIDVFFDPTTKNAFAVFRSWFDIAPGDPTEPNQPEANFMYRSIVDSFTNVP